MSGYIFNKTRTREEVDRRSMDVSQPKSCLRLFFKALPFSYPRSRFVVVFGLGTPSVEPSKIRLSSRFIDLDLSLVRSRCTVLGPESPPDGPPPASKSLESNFLLREDPSPNMLKVESFPYSTTASWPGRIVLQVRTMRSMVLS